MLSPWANPLVLRAPKHHSRACRSRRALDVQTYGQNFPTESLIGLPCMFCIRIILLNLIIAPLRPPISSHCPSLKCIAPCAHHAPAQKLKRTHSQSTVAQISAMCYATQQYKMADTDQVDIHVATVHVPASHQYTRAIYPGCSTL